MSALHVVTQEPGSPAYEDAEPRSTGPWRRWILYMPEASGRRALTVAVKPLGE
jgi:hypothetical protein